MKQTAYLLLLLILVYALSLGGNATAVDTTSAVDFTRQIRPILSDKCFLCHGPDADSREAELRLDQRKSATEDRGGYAAIVPGDPAASEFVARILSDDESLRMPPPDSKKSLTPEEIALLRQWVKEGAPYATHWAFIAPKRPPTPHLSPALQQWARNPIDRFVGAKLEGLKLSPSAPADRTTMLRRLHLDLTGLPPTIDEIEHYLADESDDAYEKLVKCLLASPHYGERWARHWLDAARYADSDGYEKDLQRDVWPYRDWVIQAFNDDMPYDEFIIEQIAGDMLPGATKQQKYATGFLRNSMVNEEGGADPEQFRVEALFDRMDAIGKAVLGITTQCAQCHTHKYDPLNHADYYGMFAFLNNSTDSYEVAFTDEQERQRRDILNRVEELESEIRQAAPDWRSRLASWAVSERGSQPKWSILKPDVKPFGGTKFRRLPDVSVISEGFAPTKGDFEFSADTAQKGITGVQVELLTDPQLPGCGPGRSLDGTAALTEFDLFIKPRGRPAALQRIKLKRASSDVNPPERPLEWPYHVPDMEGGDSRRTGPAEFAIDDDKDTAWTTDSGPATRNQPRKIVFEAAEPFGFANGTAMTIHLNQSHGGDNADARENYLLGRFRFSITTAANPSADPLPAGVRELVETKAPGDWTEQEWSLAFSYWRTTVADWKETNDRIETLLADYPDGVFQLVSCERTRPRVTHVLERGNFLSLGEIIEPHTPNFLHPFPQNAPKNRLGFAWWLVDCKSPTTARAIVNRVWQAYFGIGLVETPEDLGSQSPPPSHPQLLDWLAVELMESGWSLKHLHRLIVESATYRQSSQMTPQLAEVDPRNRYLARGPRVRVDAEIVRDVALAASGLLNDQIGGPSVYPPAPEFLFQPPASYGPKNWFTEDGTQLFRRSMYIHAYRSVPYPTMQVFDAPKGDAACVRRVRSNTPLQALTMLNETQFMDCSRALARRVKQELPEDDEARLRHAFRLCVSRHPSKKELGMLQTLLDKSRKHYQDPAQARAVLAVNEEKSAGTQVGDISEQAAWTIVCRALLNLDETITKQ